MIALGSPEIWARQLHPPSEHKIAMLNAFKTKKEEMGDLHSHLLEPDLLFPADS
jgi:hypothetical protein